MDKIFKILADKNRRQILDLVKQKPGINVNELSDHFEFSRFAVMKHLKLMEDAEVIIARKSGKNKLLYLNAIPIQFIYDRWISKFSQAWASDLSELKYSLEMEGKNMEEKLQHVFVTYIKTTKENLWNAIINGDITKKYYYNTTLRSDLKVGSDIVFVSVDKDGNEVHNVKGKILEYIEYQKLGYTFQFHDSNDKPSKVTFEIEEAGELMKLTVLHDGFEEKTETYNSVVQGWPYILSGLKTYLETGDTL